jgi:hypothetical protein
MNTLTACEKRFMKTIHSNAATALFDTLEVLSEMPHESWQCVYLKPVGANDTHHEPHSVSNAKAITDLLAKANGTIYLCEDGDIIIMFQRSPRMIVDKVSRHLGEAGPGQSRSQHTYNLFGVFDLSKHWQGFYNLCVGKYLKSLALSEERRRNARADVAGLKAAPMSAHSPALPAAAQR